MPIVAADIKKYLSGGAGNTDPNASLGGAISSTELVDNTSHNLFDNVSGAESLAGDVEYRAIFVKNTHATLTLYGAKIFISANTDSPDTEVGISVATEVGSPIQSIANEGTAPTGQAFSLADGEANGLSLGDIDPGEIIGIWLKRTVLSSAEASNDSVSIDVVGDSNP